MIVVFLTLKLYNITKEDFMYILFIIIGIIVVLILSSIRQINEYERGILFTCGKFSNIIDNE